MSVRKLWRIAERFHWLPMVSLAMAVVAVILADKAVFGQSHPQIDLGSLSRSRIDNTPGVPKEQAAVVLALRDTAARLVWMTTGLAQTIAFLLAIAYFSLNITKMIATWSWAFIIPVAFVLIVVFDRVLSHFHLLPTG